MDPARKKRPRAPEPDVAPDHPPPKRTRTEVEALVDQLQADDVNDREDAARSIAAAAAASDEGKSLVVEADSVDPLVGALQSAGTRQSAAHALSIICKVDSVARNLASSGSAAGRLVHMLDTCS